MRSIRVSILGVALVFGFAARLHAEGAAPPAATDIVTISGTVVDVDPTGRQLTLEAADGSKVVTTVGPQVTNLANLKKGDRVVVKQIVPVAVAAARAAVPASAPAAQPAAPATPGTRSSYANVDTEEITATVQSIDRAAHTVVLRANDGTSRTVKLAPDVQLDQVAVGDQATLKITKATAIAVDVPPAH
jgi:hypothetical protein